MTVQQHGFNRWNTGEATPRQPLLISSQNTLHPSVVSTATPASFGNVGNYIKLGLISTFLTLFAVQCNQSRQASKGCSCIDESGPYYHPQHLPQKDYYASPIEDDVYQGQYPEGTVKKCTDAFMSALGNDKKIKELQREWKPKGYNIDAGSADCADKGRGKPSPKTKAQQQRAKAWQWIQSWFK